MYNFNTSFDMSDNLIFNAFNIFSVIFLMHLIRLFSLFGTMRFVEVLLLSYFFSK